MLATPVMINVIEAAALNAVEHLLPAGHQSLGIHLDLTHVAATPVGLRVTATAEALRVEGRTITFTRGGNAIGALTFWLQHGRFGGRSTFRITL